MVHHPWVLLVLVRAGWRLRRRGWWRRAPFLPFPDAAYWVFRLGTINGTSEVPLSAEAVVDAAKWSLNQRTGR